MACAVVIIARSVGRGSAAGVSPWDLGSMFSRGRAVEATASHSSGVSPSRAISTAQIAFKPWISGRMGDGSSMSALIPCSNVFTSSETRPQSNRFPHLADTTYGPAVSHQIRVFLQRLAAA